MSEYECKNCKSELPSNLVSSMELACPLCRIHLDVIGETAHCEGCGRKYVRQHGIWRFLLPARAKQFEKFLEKYRRMRRAEGWGAADADYFRALPRVSPDDPQHAIWRIVANNFPRLLNLLAEIKPTRILDNGAGNGWLSYQLTSRGYTVAALDLSDDFQDGLGASIHYDCAFERYQAEFDRLPFYDEQFDVVLFSASLHYSNDLFVTLQESARVLCPNGKIIIVAAPVFKLHDSGTVLIAERERKFKELFESAQAIRANGFFTEQEIEHAALRTQMSAKFSYSDNHWLKSLRRAWIQRKIGREPARFPLIVLQKFETRVVEA